MELAPVDKYLKLHIYGSKSTKISSNEPFFGEMNKIKWRLHKHNPIFISNLTSNCIHLWNTLVINVETQVVLGSTQYKSCIRHCLTPLRPKFKRKMIADTKKSKITNQMLHEINNQRI